MRDGGSREARSDAVGSRGIQADDPIGKMLSTRFAVVDAEDDLSVVVGTIPRVDIVLVREAGKLVGVVTKIDLLTHLTEHA